MASNPTVSVKKRELQGRKVKQLRREGIVPANIFGSGVKSQSIQVDQSDFQKLYQSAGETSVIDLKVDGAQTVLPVLIHQVQLDPVSDSILHIDFLQVDLKKKVTTQVSVEVVGESPAVKDKAATMVLAINELEIEALPNDIPENIQIDISSLKDFGDTLQVKDLTVDSKVTLITDPEAALVIIQEPKAEEEVEVSTEAVEGEEGESDAESAESSDDKPEDSKDKDSDATEKEANKS